MKIDIIALTREEFKQVLEELTKEDLIRIMLSLQKELKEEFEKLEFELTKIPFERIRRITGYLVGTTDRFNNAKKAEEKERVKHNVQQD